MGFTLRVDPRFGQKYSLTSFFVVEGCLEQRRGFPRVHRPVAEVELGHVRLCAALDDDVVRHLRVEIHPFVVPIH